VSSRSRAYPHQHTHASVQRCLCASRADTVRLDGCASTHTRLCGSHRSRTRLTIAAPVE
jgi:hypothetical protein